MAGISIIVLFIMFIGFIVAESLSIGFLVTGIIVAISFTITSHKEKKKVGNKVALPICLITVGVTGLIPGIILLIYMFL